MVKVGTTGVDNVIVSFAVFLMTTSDYDVRIRLCQNISFGKVKASEHVKSGATFNLLFEVKIEQFFSINLGDR